MTDKEFSIHKSRVLKGYHRWNSATGLGSWIVTHIWHRDGTAGNPSRDRGEYVTSARTSVAWQYLHVTFHWNLESLSTNNDEELDRIIRHEICHVLVSEMREWAGSQDMDRSLVDSAMMHEERTVTVLANILRWCRMEGQRDKLPNKKRKN